MKTATDLGQSRELSEILPKETSDCNWNTTFDNEWNCWMGSSNSKFSVQAWSLTALFGVIPKHINNYPKHIKNYNVLRIDISDNDFAIWYDEIGYGLNNNLPDITMESAVDSCYEMIMRLHELNLL